MSRSRIPTAIRQLVLEEAGQRCACDPSRHVDIVTAGVSELEVHHIQPWSIVRIHKPENLIALCPSCHARADQGVIPQWALVQLKQVCQLRQATKADWEKKIAELIREYVHVRKAVLGEGYYTAAAFFDFARRCKLDAPLQVAFVSTALGDVKTDPALVVVTLRLELNQTDEALALLRLCEKTTKKTPQYMRKRADTWLRHGQYRLAHKWYTRAAAAGDSSLALYCNWGDCMGYIAAQMKTQYARRDWLRRALTKFDSVDVEDPAVLFNKARVLVHLGDKEAAIECLQRATVLGKHYPLPHVALGFLYADANRSTDALREFDEAVRRRPRNLAFLLDAAEYALRWGERERGVQYLQMFQQESRYFTDAELNRIAELRRRFALRHVLLSRHQLTRRCTG